MGRFCTPSSRVDVLPWIWSEVRYAYVASNISHQSSFTSWRKLNRGGPRATEFERFPFPGHRVGSRKIGWPNCVYSDTMASSAPSCGLNSPED